MAKWSRVLMQVEMNILKALADESRVRALLALRRGELCVCQLIALLGLAPSTVSKHLAVLRQAGLVVARKQGRWIYYRLPGEDAPPVVGRTFDWLFATFARKPQAVADRRRLAEILAQSPEGMCSP
jgi:ArsR family transcriptional regulator